MWAFVFLCSVLVTHGVKGWTTPGMDTTPEPSWTTPGMDATSQPDETTELASADPVASCGGNLYSSSGNFYSPNYPNSYPNNADCTWYINPGRQIIQLEFSLINTECNYDEVYIYDGSSIGSRMLGHICNKNKYPIFHSTGFYLTVRFRSDSSITRSGFSASYRIMAQGLCKYNCGYQVGQCSCSSSCEYRGNCCADYYESCQNTSVSTTSPTYTAQPSCRYNCGSHMGSCSCSSSCQYYGNCCHDYYSQCSSTTESTVTARPSCRYNCGYNLGSCSCSSSCEYYGNCCHDYYSHCRSTTGSPVTARPSCRYNCGYNLGSCSCSSSCQYYGNCCYDYYSHCSSTTRSPVTARPSCRYNCGYNLGSCSCSSSCQYYGNCCHDYYSHCSATTTSPVTARPSCRYNCGYNLGSCSCSSSCQYYGNCCHDYYSQCSSTTRSPVTAQQSCRYNCGYHLGSCSCTSSCRNYGNCCHDYSSYCSATTYRPVRPTTVYNSCRYNCGRHLGSCSCSSSCSYNGNCCRDYYSYCAATTPTGSCGGSLFGSGTVSSPNYPNYYNDNSYCVWQLRAAYDQRIFLAFTYLQLENCCTCDYISIYDGPSVNSRFLGKVCNSNNNQTNTFYSTSNYMTVLFRTDGSVVGRGFNAEFMSSLKPSSGRVDCSSDNMNIVIDRSYLNSLGYDGHSLYLNDPLCRPQVSPFQVVFSFPLNTCGNVRKFVNGRIVYTNDIRAYASSYGEITRQSHLKLNVTCLMEPDSESQILFAVDHPGNSSITGSGRFNTSMAFYTSSSFYEKVTQVPYEVTLNQNLYVQVDLRRRDSTLVLFIDTCVASPSPFDFHSRPYYLVRDGCRVDDTYRQISSGTSARFTFRAFQFLRATDSVYIQCKVIICPTSDSNSRCRRGCSRRVARGLESEHDSQTLVVGPIKLKDNEKQKEEPEKQNKA